MDIKDSASLADLLDARKNDIEHYLYLGKAKWENLSKKIRRQEISQSIDFKDEQIWTFLLACGYALSGTAGVRRLTSILTGSEQIEPPQPQIWFETLPIPPRVKEGNANIDLACGSISNRGSTKSGIQLENMKQPWICFCEMKFTSDITLKTTHDNNRNQLIRVIENALCFQNSGNYADKIYVSLVTPDFFHYKKMLKEYKVKFEKYRDNPDSIKQDLINIDKREQPCWHYPKDISALINKLSLNWVSYEDLFNQLPVPTESDFKQLFQEIKLFWERFGLSLGDWYQGLLAAEARAGGVLAYAPLMQKLKESAQDAGERKRVAINYLPIALSCALQNDECLQDIKNVAEAYPDLISDILTSAINLRKDKHLSSWTNYESNLYKDFIKKLENQA